MPSLIRVFRDSAAWARSGRKPRAAEEAVNAAEARNRRRLSFMVADFSKSYSKPPPPATKKAARMPCGWRRAAVAFSQINYAALPFEFHWPVSAGGGVVSRSHRVRSRTEIRADRFLREESPARAR